MGAAELSALLKEYAGSHIMTFAGYNAGRGRVRDWVKLYGDPRDPNVDAIDWVERIPLSETRNYVQRVIENLQVYRVRFDSGASVISKSDGRPGNPQEANSAQLSLAPTSPSP
jgi:soluble lytic murein transglycosylase